MKIKNILAEAPVDTYMGDIGKTSPHRGSPVISPDLGAGQFGGAGRNIPNPKAKGPAVAPAPTVAPGLARTAPSKITPAAATPAAAAKPTTTPTRIEPTLTPPRIVVKPGETAAQAVQRTQKDIQAKTAPAGKQKIEPNLAGGPPQVWRKGDGTTPIGTPAAAKGQTITGKIGGTTKAEAPPVSLGQRAKGAATTDRKSVV